jgi:hypothetical protein
MDGIYDWQHNAVPVGGLAKDKEVIRKYIKLKPQLDH